MEVSGAESKEEPTKEVSNILTEHPNKKGHRGKNKGTSQSSVSKKTGGAKDKAKRKRATPEVEPETFELGPGPQVNVDDGGTNKKTIIDNISYTKRLERHSILYEHHRRPRMDALHDIVLIQYWLHLFDTNSPLLREE